MINIEFALCVSNRERESERESERKRERARQTDTVFCMSAEHAHMKVKVISVVSLVTVHSVFYYTDNIRQ